jgi:hypothetical protein
MLRGPDHFASAGPCRRATVKPAAATVARPLSGLLDIALEAKSRTNGTISTKARKNRTSLFARTEPKRSDRFSSHKAFPRHQKCLEEIFGFTDCPHRFAKRTARSGLLVDRTAIGPVPGIAVIRYRFYDLPAVMATPFRCL